MSSSWISTTIPGPWPRLDSGLSSETPSVMVVYLGCGSAGALSCTEPMVAIYLFTRVGNRTQTSVESRSGHSLMKPSRPMTIKYVSSEKFNYVAKYRIT